MFLDLFIYKFKAEYVNYFPLRFVPGLIRQVFHVPESTSYSSEKLVVWLT